MDSRDFLAFSVCFLLVFPILSSATLSKKNESTIKQKSDGSFFVFDPTRVTQLSWSPRIFSYTGFLSDEECDHLVTLATGKLEKSTVVDEKGEIMESEVRTSSGMFINRRSDDIVANIEDRLAAFTFLPEENGESIQVLRYQNGQKFEPHFDNFNDNYKLHYGGNRVATVLMYLSDVEKGGETVFPNAEIGISQPKDDSWSDCAKQGYAVKPKKGDALLFFSLHHNGTADWRSLHQSCPVIEGEKWSATKWIHDRAFVVFDGEGGECEDYNEECKRWAEIGECKKNPTYMVGTDTDPGFCRKSCNVC